MRHHIFNQADSYAVALILKPTAFDKHQVKKHYVDPLTELGLKEDVIAVTALLGTAKEIKDHYADVLPKLKELGVKLLYVAEGQHFKILTKQGKAEPHAGYVLPCALEDHEDLNVVLGFNYQQLVYNPELKGKLDLGLQTVVSAMQGAYVAPGSNIIHSAQYPHGYEAVKAALLSLLDKPELTCDIEAFGLRIEDAGIATIAFAWNEHEALAFPVDYTPFTEAKNNEYGYRTNNIVYKTLLREFFEHYQGKLVFHNGAYDVKVLIYELWMKDSLDMEGMLVGLETMTKNLDDTKIIAYLSYNSTAGNVLNLKALAHEFAGNYAIDEIKDIRRISLAKLLEYNLVDTLCTAYIKKRDYPKMVADQQEAIYKDLMLPSLKLIIQIELCGMPMDMGMVEKAKMELSAESQKHLDVITNSPLTQMFNERLQYKTMEMANSKLKKKQHPIENFRDVVFNPNSGPQLQDFLYEMLGLPVLDYTETKLPATGGDTLNKLTKHTSDPQILALLNALIGYAGVEKILSAFIPAFEKALRKSDKHYYLHGGFNLGGTVSGRLSSSNPNLQQIPSGSAYGKLIKKCFKAPKGWLFCGADFNSLEDYISALTTKDPNKLGVYLNGFDGHCLRAAYYFRDQLPHINLDDPKSVNSIKKTHPELRQDSKAPTFLLTYGGTYHGMMANLGWPEDKSKAIEANYHELYKVSDEYVAERLKQASKDGYVEVAFGLRVRTPLLAQVMWGSDRVPYEAQAEGRTAGNALGQSYGLLNNRAAVAFMNKVWQSPYRHDIKPVALIHDAIYLMVRDDLAVVSWVNQNLIQEMRWQELPEIQHPQVKLGAALDLFWPDWSNPITLPNDAPAEEILKLCAETKSLVSKET
jgi:DNA polymerase I